MDKVLAQFAAAEPVFPNVCNSTKIQIQVHASWRTQDFILEGGNFKRKGGKGKSLKQQQGKKSLNKESTNTSENNVQTS